MPELPEVETIARGLAKRVVDDVIESVWLGSKPEPLKSSASEIAATLQSKRISDVRRLGKHIVVDLAGENGAAGSAQWIVHLGMTGNLLLCPPDAEVAKHTHAIVTFDRGVLLYDDARQFGAIEFHEQFPKRVARLGPEPLEVSYEDFAAGMKRRKTRVKALLLNQTFVRGVGNIYADEALFRAGIHPEALASRIRKDRARRLHAALAGLAGAVSVPARREAVLQYLNHLEEGVARRDPLEARVTIAYATLEGDAVITLRQRRQPPLVPTRHVIK